MAPGAAETTEDVDFDAVLRELDEKVTGMSEHFEPENPGMHTTDTIDFEYIVSGEVWLELDDGEELLLQAGDTLIQNGTCHAWRNKSTEPCVILACLVGANRR